MKKFSIGDRVEIDGENKGYISAMKKNRSKKSDSKWLYDISFSDYSDISENRIMSYADRIMYTENQKSFEGYLHSSYDTLNNNYNLELDNGKKINNCADASYNYYYDIVEVQTKENYWEKGYRIGANIKPNGEKMYQVLLFKDKGVLWSDVQNNKIKRNILEANVRSSYAEAHYEESKPIKIYGVYFEKTTIDYDTDTKDNKHIYLNAPNISKVLKYKIKDDSNTEVNSIGNKVKIKDDKDNEILFNIKTTTCQPVTAFNKSDQVKRSYIFVGLLLLFVVHFGMYYAFKYFHNNKFNSLYVYGSGFFSLIIIVICCIIFLAKPSFANTTYKNKDFNILNTVSWLLLGFTIVIIINLWIYFINFDAPDPLFEILNPASPTFIDNIKSIGNLFKYSN